MIGQCDIGIQASTLGNETTDLNYFSFEDLRPALNVIFTCDRSGGRSHHFWTSTKVRHQFWINPKGDRI